MGKVVYDFREPIESEKRVYKKEGVNWKEAFYYLGFLLLTWGYTVGFFALFQYAYIIHEPVAFWVYCGIWLAFTIALLIIIIINICSYKEEDTELDEQNPSTQPQVNKPQVQSQPQTQKNNQVNTDGPLATNVDEKSNLNPK